MSDGDYEASSNSAWCQAAMLVLTLIGSGLFFQHMLNRLDAADEAKYREDLGQCEAKCSPLRGALPDGACYCDNRFNVPQGDHK